MKSEKKTQKKALKLTKPTTKIKIAMIKNREYSVLKKYSIHAKTQGAQATCDVLVRNWANIASFSGLSGGFCFFVLTQNTSFQNGIIDAETAKMGYYFLLTTSFCFCYLSVALCLALSNTMIVMMKLDHSKCTEEQETWREQSLKKFISTNEKFFDIPMALAIISVACVVTAIIFYLMGTLNNWLWIYSTILMSILASFGFSYAVFLDYNLHLWIRGFYLASTTSPQAVVPVAADL